MKNTENQKPIYRRFVCIGTSTEQGKAERLIDEKGLERDDLFLILKAFKLKPDFRQP